MPPSNHSDLPLEIWREIFKFSCTDNGGTGRSLSLVSKQINKFSKPFKYQSITIAGIQELIKFLLLLQGLPPEERRVRWLCLVTEHIYGDLYDHEDSSYHLPASHDEMGWCSSASEPDSDDDKDAYDVGSDMGDEDDEESVGNSTDSEELEYAEATLEEIQEAIQDIIYLDRVDIDPEYAGYQYQQSSPPDLITEEEIEEAQANIQARVNSLLELCSPTIYQFVIDVSFRYPFELPIILPPSCPHLWELVTKNPIEIPDQLDGKPVYPTLERLCWLPGGDVHLPTMLPQIRILMPNLTHLRIPYYDERRSEQFLPVEEFLKTRSTKGKQLQLIVDHDDRFILVYISPRFKKLRELYLQGDISIAYVRRKDGNTIQRWLRGDDSFWDHTQSQGQVDHERR